LRRLRDSRKQTNGFYRKANQSMAIKQDTYSYDQGDFVLTAKQIS